MNWHKFNNLSILVIDDDQFTRELIGSMLGEVPTIEVHQARDALEALQLFENNKYDMLLLDLYMPTMSGSELIKNLTKKNQLESLPVVLMTTDRLSKYELRDIGADYYLTKPFDFVNFLNNIYGFLEQERLCNET